MKGHKVLSFVGLYVPFIKLVLYCIRFKNVQQVIDYQFYA
jgi:hypothetical protein